MSPGPLFADTYHHSHHHLHDDENLDQMSSEPLFRLKAEPIEAADRRDKQPRPILPSLSAMLAEPIWFNAGPTSDPFRPQPKMQSNFQNIGHPSLFQPSAELLALADAPGQQQLGPPSMNLNKYLEASHSSNLGTLSALASSLSASSAPQKNHMSLPIVPLAINPQQQQQQQQHIQRQQQHMHYSYQSSHPPHIVPSPLSQVHQSSFSQVVNSSQHQLRGHHDQVFNVIRRRSMYRPSRRMDLKCEFCGRSESPEWRRGPSGANALCNACGIKYAKKRKLSAHSNLPNTTSGTTNGSSKNIIGKSSNISPAGKKVAQDISSPLSSSSS